MSTSNNDTFDPLHVNSGVKKGLTNGRKFDAHFYLYGYDEDNKLPPPAKEIDEPLNENSGGETGLANGCHFDETTTTTILQNANKEDKKSSPPKEIIEPLIADSGEKEDDFPSSHEGFGSCFTFPTFAPDSNNLRRSSSYMIEEEDERMERPIKDSILSTVVLTLCFNTKKPDSERRFFSLGGVSLRYSNFVAFRKQLEAEFKTLIIPPLPPKDDLITFFTKPIRGEKEINLEMRRIGLERFLQRLLLWSKDNEILDLYPLVVERIRKFKANPPSESIIQQTFDYTTSLRFRGNYVFNFKQLFSGMLPDLKKKIEIIRSSVEEKLQKDQSIIDIPDEFSKFVLSLFSLREQTLCEKANVSKEDIVKTDDQNVKFQLFQATLQKHSEIVERFTNLEMITVFEKCIDAQMLINLIEQFCFTCTDDTYRQSYNAQIKHIVEEIMNAVRSIKDNILSLTAKRNKALHTLWSEFSADNDIQQVLSDFAFLQKNMSPL